MIELNEVTVAYTKDFNAIQDINLKVQQGERVVIFGEENSGKSSLLRVIVGLEKPNKGEAYIKGMPAHKANFKELVSVGYLPARPVFMENKTVVDNLEYPLKIRKVDKNMQQVKLFNAIKSYGLEALKEVKVKELSYYDRVKVCLARLALRNIEIFVIDDVFKKLDENETKKVVDYIEDLIEFNNATSIIATDDEKILNKLGGKAITIENGSLVN